MEGSTLCTKSPKPDFWGAPLLCDKFWESLVELGARVELILGLCVLSDDCTAVRTFRGRPFSTIGCSWLIFSTYSASLTLAKLTNPYPWWLADPFFSLLVRGAVLVHIEPLRQFLGPGCLHITAWQMHERTTQACILVCAWKITSSSSTPA